MSGAGFSVAAESDGAGRFARPEAAFRGRVAEPEAGRYHLYVSWACPWAHRTAIARELLGLAEAVSLSAVDPYRDERGWAFTGGEYVDPINGWSLLHEAYAATDPSFAARVSVPVLWDTEAKRIVNNESAEILRILQADFAALHAPGAPDLYPRDARAEIDAVNARVYDTVNNGVYRAGFATSQAAYEESVVPLFASLDWLEARLAERRYLAGTPQPTEADWRLFTTLVRFDSVYVSHFKCSVRRLVDLPNLWAYTRDLLAHPGVAPTLRLDEIKRHYYTTHGSINPTGVVPVGPELDWTAPHGRDALR